VVEARTVELEWPARLRLGDSDVVRLALLPTTDGYQLSADFPEHETESQPVEVQRIAGYDLWAVASLDAVGFSVSPEGEQARTLPERQAVTWLWTVRPAAPGQQRLSMTLLLRWIPAEVFAGAPRQAQVYARGLDVDVTSFFGLTRGQAMTGGFFGLFFGASLCLVALVAAPLRVRTVLDAQAPNPDLIIEPVPGLALSSEERGLLQILFRRYARLVLESEFQSGYSGARTFLAQPVRTDGRSDAYTIVKIGQRRDIQAEFENYEIFVKDTLPPITARIQHPPVVYGRPAPIPGLQSPARKAAGSRTAVQRAALQYTFIAEPGHLPASLRQVLLRDPDPAILEKLFNTFGPNWWMQRRPYTFRLAQEYDRVLPTHYVIEPCSGRGMVLDGESPPAGIALQSGDMVRLCNFHQAELRADGESLSLRGKPADGQPPLRVRWLSLLEPEGANGRVVATRADLLRGLAAGIDLCGLPDPLERLPDLLQGTLSGTQSTIHGDLNLENALLGPGGFLWLIDFAQTRDGHTLFDFAHLEAEIIAQVIAPQLSDLQDFLLLLERDSPNQAAQFASLLSTVESIASRCLFNPSQPREYHLAAMMACLGALKYANLDAHQKHFLLLNAAHLCRYI
jgi:hypothetical protein